LTDMKGLLIGAGALGRNLYSLCISQGILFSAVVEKDTTVPNIPSDVVFNDLQQLPPDISFDFIALCVEDKNIEAIVKDISETFQNLSGKYCFHTSGALDSSILVPLKEKETFTGSLHPLMTFQKDPLLSSVKDVPFAIEGDPPCQQFLQELVILLQGKAVTVPSALKISYHLLGVFASNFMYGLIDGVNTILAQLNRDGLNISGENLAPIINQTLRSAFQSEISNDTISGPVQRKDFNIIRRHIIELDAKFPDQLSLYREISLSLAKICHYSENDLRELKTALAITPPLNR